jgi:2-polyprenyl-3-methyl-5-hydroxy-6-metoxy-1,4-benzoquinol methylase
MPIVNYKLQTYEYFKHFHAGIDQGELLDYGCNYGTFLNSNNCKLDYCRYTGIDVDSEAIDHGRILFPQATFVHYNAHNFVYNPGGQQDNRYDFGKKFHTVISYSVLTHTSKDDFFQTIEWLYSLLHNGGKLLITYLNVEHTPTLEFFTRKRIADYGSCDKIHTESFCYLVDNRIETSLRNSNHLLLFFNNKYLTKQLSQYNFLLLDAPRHIPTCFQSCMVISK